MLRRVMLYLMILITAGKFAAIAWLFSTSPDRLPVSVYIVSGIVVAAGLALICKNIIKTAGKREFAWFYGICSVAAAVNLVLMKLSSRIELNLVDLMVIGSVLDIVLGVTLIVMTLRESRYIRIKVSS